MFTGIRALAVYVTDKERAKRFYIERLGFELKVDLGPDLCFLRSPNSRIQIYLEGGMREGGMREAGMRAAGADNRSARLGFFLQAEGSAAAAHARLREAGVAVLQVEPEVVADDTACFQVLDPDGNIIDISGTTSE